MKIKIPPLLRILAGLLIVQVGLSVFTFWPRTAAGQAAPLFADLDTAAVTRVDIRAGTGDEVTMARSGDGWVMPDADDFPVTADKVTALLDKIAALSTDRLVTNTAASQARLQVADDDYATRIALTDADGKETVLYLGSSPGYNSVHVRAGGEDATYLTSALSTWDAATTAASWIETAYVDVSSADLTALTLHNSHGDLVLTLGDDGLWSLAGLGAEESLDQARVQSLIGRATTYNITQPLGRSAKPEYGLDAPVAEVVLTTADGETTIQIGAEDTADSSYVVKASSSDYYVKSAAYSIQDLVDATHDSLLVPPATATPTVAAPAS